MITIVNGCMRCKYGATPQCKVNNWREELETLRQIILETGLKEEVKWGVPVYTNKGKNIVSVSALKESATIGFFKGALLSDNQNVLVQQETIQAARVIRFTSLSSIQTLEKTLKAYILEAITIEESGKKVLYSKEKEAFPEELVQAFENDRGFKKAFYALTPGRQRGYTIYFSQPKQSVTRSNRIEKCKQQIFEGIGLNDRYKK